MKFQYYIENFIKYPYDKTKKTILWNPTNIPVTSNGIVKDWENEPNPPFYADLNEDGNKIPYYQIND